MHTDLDVVVRFAERKLSIHARVRRKFQDGERSYFGLQFLSISAEDLAFLFQKLYGRPYTSEEDNKWVFMHHPFTMPHDEDLDKLESLAAHRLLL